MAKILTEFIGTFFLVLVIGLAVAGGSPSAPFAIGGALIALVYMGGHISGAQYNPAVSIAVYLRGGINGVILLQYLAAQFSAAIAAGFLSKLITGKALTIAPGAGVSDLTALGVEALFTFALASVILNVATSKDHPNNHFYGLAIGLTVLAGAIAAGPISGAAFNPAVTLGHNIVSRDLSGLGIYFAGQFAGAATAAWIFRLTNPEEFKGGRG